MKRKLVMKMLCITIVSAMLISNTAVLSASDFEGEPAGVESGQEMPGVELPAEGNQEEGELIPEPEPEPEPAPEPELATYTITWCNEDGSVIATVSYTEGEAIPGYDGAIPSKNETDTHTFEFTGWATHDDGAGNVTYTAQFAEVAKKISVTWVDGNDHQLSKKEIEKGSEVPEYDGETPAKAPTETHTYEFNGEWEESVDDAGNITYTAQFKEAVKENGSGGGSSDTKPAEPENTDESTEVSEETEEGEPEESKEEETENPLTDAIEETLSYNNAETSSWANVTPAITAGVGFYVEELEDKYKLTFGDGFADMIKAIEEEAEKNAAEMVSKKAEEKAKDPEALAQKTKSSDKKISASATVAEAEQILIDRNNEELEENSKILNLQDVVAVYLLKQKKAGVSEFVLDESSKAGLAKVFSEMNTASVENGEVVFKPMYVEDYIKKNKLTKEDQEFLEEYTSINCMLLCAASTGVQGFITESLGEDISAERAKVVGAAYSLVGKICYYYGGKSSVIGWDSRWGALEEVAAQGGPASDFGLDCSGYVTWAFINGYESNAATSYIGHGTTAQWNNSEEIGEEEARPGDLVFLNAPPADGPNNHIGIVVGKDSDNQLIVAHCNASDNTVTVESAYEAGFRYIRRPQVYNELSEEQVDQMVADAR